MPRGGARPGAGRKPKREQFGPQIESAERRCVNRLPKNLASLEMLADGGYEQVTETWEPAGLIYVTKQVETKDGTVRVSELAFPEIDPTELVCVRRTRSIAAPDRAAAIYLVDRAMGKPVAAVESDVQVNAGDGLLEAFGAAVAKIYGGEGGS